MDQVKFVEGSFLKILLRPLLNNFAVKSLKFKVAELRLTV